MEANMNWVAFEAIATCILAGGILFVILQIWEQRRGRNAQLAISLSQEFRGIETREIFRLIYYSIYEDGILKDTRSGQQLSESEYRKVADVIDKLEFIGVLVAGGIVDASLAINLFKGPSIRCWACLSGFIEGRREERGHYARYFQDFVKRSVKYQIEHDPRKEWTKLTLDKSLEKALVNELQFELLSPYERRIGYNKRWVKSLFVTRLRN
jgi:hypothetical protein